MSLGAFLAGVLLADSEFRHELEADLEPFKGLLLGLFFIAVGMSANLGLMRLEPLTVLALTAGFLAIKVLVITLVGRLGGMRADSARRLGFSLPAGGEFAFVLFTLAARQRLLDAQTADLLVLAVTLSMMLGPLLLLGFDAIVKNWLSAAAPAYDNIEERDIPVIIAGFGRFGQIVARVLRLQGHPVHRARQQPDARRLRAPLRQPGVLRGRLAAGPAARRRGADRAVPGAGDRRRRGLHAHRGGGARAVPAPEDLRARTQPPACLRADGRGRAERQCARPTPPASRWPPRCSRPWASRQRTSREVVRRFREHDEATLLAQYAVKEDDAKFLATSREAAGQLEKLFEADRGTKVE